MPAIAQKKPRPNFETSLLEILPEQGFWSESAYLWLTDNTNRLVEFTDGEVEVLPMPTDKHQLYVKYLLYAIQAVLDFSGGMVQFAPLPLHLKRGRYREPDILVLMDPEDSRRNPRFWTGADLVAEVVSEDDPDRDLVQKKREYAQAGIAEYWIVNPLDETIIVYRLQGKRYARHGVFGRGQTATSVLLPKLAVDVTALFDAKR